MTIRNPNPVMNLFVIDGITSSQLGKAQKPNAVTENGSQKCLQFS